ncbi:MAG TPA: hypothetical protein EYH22_01835 [Candidatus Nanopusillus sp.]|nr:hypothetical protein [Candidatus Nanopusillus sp.]
MVLPLVILAGGTIAGLALQWHGQQQEYNLQKKKLSQLERKVLQQTRRVQQEQQVMPIIVLAIIGAVIFMFIKKRK